MNAIQLRQPQLTCLEVLAENADDPEVAIEMWCGVGKTLCIFLGIERAGVERAVIIVPSLALVRQIKRDYIDKFGLSGWEYVCSESGSEFCSAQDYTGNGNLVTTYHSFPLLAEDHYFDIAVLDEAHRFDGDIDNADRVWRFSATLPPDTATWQYGLAEAIEDGYAQDFVLECFVDRAEAERDTAELLAKMADETGNRKQLVFTRYALTETQSVAAWMAAHASEIRKRGGWVKAITGETPAHEREAILCEFETRTGWSVLVSCRVLSEGVDTKGADAVYFADPKGSHVDILQNLGRATRRKDHDRPASIIVPVFVDVAKYEACTTREESSKRLEEEMRTKDGDFRPILSVLVAVREQCPDWEAFFNKPRRRSRTGEGAVRDPTIERVMRFNVRNTLQPILWALDGDGDLLRRLVASMEGGSRSSNRALAMAETYIAMTKQLGHQPSSASNIREEKCLAKWIYGQKLARKAKDDLAFRTTYIYHPDVDSRLTKGLGSEWYVLQSDIHRKDRAIAMARSYCAMTEKLGRTLRIKSQDTEENRHAVWIRAQKQARAQAMGDTSVRTTQTYYSEVDAILANGLGPEWYILKNEDYRKEQAVAMARSYCAMTENLGRTLRTKSDDAEERRLAFWILRQKQARAQPTGETIKTTAYCPEVDAVLTGALGPEWYTLKNEDYRKEQAVAMACSYCAMTEKLGREPSTCSKDADEKRHAVWIISQKKARPPIDKTGSEYYPEVDAILTGGLGPEWYTFKKEDYRKEKSMEMARSYCAMFQLLGRKPSTPSKDKEEQRCAQWLAYQKRARAKAMGDETVKNKSVYYDEVGHILENALGEGWWHISRGKRKTDSTSPSTRTTSSAKRPRVDKNPRAKFATMSREELINKLATQAERTRGKFPSDRRADDDAKVFCNEAFVAAASSQTDGLVVCLDSPAMFITLKLVEAGVSLDRMVCPQFDADEYEEMKEWPHVRPGSLRVFLEEATPSSISSLWMDYCASWEGNENVRPREDARLLLERGVIKPGGWVGVTVCMQRIDSSRRVAILIDMAQVFAGWKLEVTKEYDQMVFVGFRAL